MRSALEIWAEQQWRYEHRDVAGSDSFVSKRAGMPVYFLYLLKQAGMAKVVSD